MEFWAPGDSSVGGWVASGLVRWISNANEFALGQDCRPSVTDGDENGDTREELVGDEWDWLAELLFFASDALAFTAQESG